MRRGLTGRELVQFLGLTLLSALYAQPLWSQQTFLLDFPPGSNSVLTLNGQSYTKDDIVEGFVDNSGTFNIVPGNGGLYQVYFEGSTNTFAPGTNVPSPTSMNLALTSSSQNVAFTNAGNVVYQYLSTGLSAPITPTQTYYQNNGPSLGFSSNGVVALVNLGSGIGQGYLIQSLGADGSNDLQQSVHEANAGSGGPISATFLSGINPETLGAVVYGQPTASQVIPWLVGSSAIQVSSLGGGQATRARTASGETNLVIGPV